MKKWLVIALLVAAAVVVVFVTPMHEWLEPSRAATWLRAVGDRWWAPLVFIAFYSLFNLVLIPATILSLTAGAVWGWAIGGFWVLVASTIGSAIPYFIARRGSPAVERMIHRRAGRLYDSLQEEGFITLLLMRLVPIVPYNLLNYAAGLAGIRPRDYLLATFIGTIPGIFIFTYLADSIAKGVVSPRGAFLRILLSGILLGGLALLTRLFAKRVRARLDR